MPDQKHWLQHKCGVAKGDRVLLDMQNCPQFVIAYYAILRADAVVVPVSPMNVTDELAHYIDDSGSNTALVGQEVYKLFRPMVGTRVENLIVATYSKKFLGQGLSSWKTRRGAERAEKIIAVSQFTKQEIHEVFDEDSCL